MQLSTELMERLAWDSEHFGKEVYRCLENDPDADQGSQADIIYQFTSSPATKDIPGFALGYQGSLCTYETDNLSQEAVKTVNLPMGQADPELETLALSSGMFSRFRVDMHLSHRDFERLYRIWWQKCVTGERADSILAYPGENEVLGLITLQKHHASAEIGLLAVAEKHWRQGIGLELLRGAAAWAVQNNCQTLRVRTQGDNLASRALYTSFGLHLEQEVFVRHFHKIRD